MARGGLDVDALAFHHRSQYALQANWKVAVENFLECYHCAVAHPGFSDVIDVDEEAYRLETHPTFASHYARVRERPRGAHYDASGGLDGQFHLVWPALKVNVMPGRPNLSIGPLTPVYAGQHRRACSTTSSRPTRTPRGSPTSWRSTTRSAPRIACSWSPCSAG